MGRLSQVKQKQTEDFAGETPQKGSSQKEALFQPFFLLVTQAREVESHWSRGYVARLHEKGQVSAPVRAQGVPTSHF